MIKNKNSQKGYRKILKDTLNNFTNDEILDVLQKRVEGIEFNNLVDSSDNDEVNFPDFIHIEEFRKFLEE